MGQRAVNPIFFTSPNKSNQKGVHIFNIQFNLGPKNHGDNFVLFRVDNAKFIRLTLADYPNSAEVT